MKKINLIALLFVLLVSSCAPKTKEAYLDDYKHFIDKVANERKGYGAVQWKKAKIEFKQYSEEWYQEFENELTVKERLSLAGYGAKFAYYYAMYEAGEAVGDVMDVLKSSDKKSLKATIENYIENDLDDDLNDLYKEAEEIGGETLELVKELFDELDIKK